MKLLLKKSYFDSLNSTTWWCKKYLSLFSFYNKLWNFIYLLGHQKKIVFEDKKYFSSTYKKNNLSYGLKYVSKKTSAAPAWAGISLDRMERIYSYSSWK